MAFAHGKGVPMLGLKAAWDWLTKNLLLVALGGCAGLALTFCVLFFLAERKADRFERRATLAEDAAAEATEETKRTVQALEASESRNNARQESRQELRDDEAQILQNPVTADCMASPAIRDALDILRQRGAGDQTERDSPE